MNATMTMTPTMGSTRTAAGVWTELPGRPDVSKKLGDRLVPRASGRRIVVAEDASLWRATMAVIEPVRWERVLGIALASSGVAGLVWIVLVCAQFASAWANLAAWVRAAML
jgi:hypothetical protein